MEIALPNARRCQAIFGAINIDALGALIFEIPYDVAESHIVGAGFPRPIRIISQTVCGCFVMCEVKRAGKPRPYGCNHKDCVDVIRHNLKNVQYDMRKTLRQFVPHSPNDFAVNVWRHCAGAHAPENAAALMRAHRQEISAGRGVIVSAPAQ